MSHTIITQKRPISITLICIVGFIGAVLVIPVIFSPIAEQVGAWYPPYLGFTALAGLISLIGLWLMRKWGVYFYTALTILNQIVTLVMGVWNFMVLLVPLIIVVISWLHVSKMK